MDLEEMPFSVGHADCTIHFLHTICLLWNLTSSWGSEGILMPIGVDLGLDCIGKWMKGVKPARLGHQHGWAGWGIVTILLLAHVIRDQCMVTFLVWNYVYHTSFFWVTNTNWLLLKLNGILWNLIGLLETREQYLYTELELKLFFTKQIFSVCMRREIGNLRS